MQSEQTTPTPTLTPDFTSQVTTNSAIKLIVILLCLCSSTQTVWINGLVYFYLFVKTLEFLAIIPITDVAADILAEWMVFVFVIHTGDLVHLIINWGVLMYAINILKLAMLYIRSNPDVNQGLFLLYHAIVVGVYNAYKPFIQDTHQEMLRMLQWCGTQQVTLSAKNSTGWYGMFYDNVGHYFY